MVWPCPLPVDAYVAAGRAVEFPRPAGPACRAPMVLWAGYWRHVRAAGRCRKIFVPRLRCGPCRVSHALLPAFVLAWRLDVAETVGAVIAEVAGGGCGVRPAAARQAVPYTTARGWVRRFGRRARGGGDRRGGRAEADRGRARGAGPADRRARPRAPRRVVPPLLAGHDRPVAAGVAQGRAGRAAALAPG